MFFAWIVRSLAITVVALGISVAQAQPQQYTSVVIDGALPEWTQLDRLDLYPWQGTEGDQLYGDFGADNYLFAIRSNLLAPGAQVTIWINSDRNAATGYQVFGTTGGAEYHVQLAVGGQAFLYSGAPGGAAIAGPLAFASTSGSLEVAVPKSLLGGASAVNLLFSIDGTAVDRFLPSNFAAFQYPQNASDRPVRTSTEKRIAIVYSPTSSVKFFDLKAYSHLFMVAQAQSMMAGVPFDLFDESALLDVANFVNYDAVVFPSMTHIPLASRGQIERTLLDIVHRYKIGLITSGDFVTNSETGAVLPGDPYLLTRTLFGVASNGGGGPVTYSIKTSAAAHPSISGYGPNQTIATYTNGFWRSFSPLQGIAASTVVTQSVGAVTAPAVVATELGGRNVYFSSPAYFGDNNLGWSALRWVIYGSGPAVALQMGRQKSMFFSRNDMDQSQFVEEFNDVYPPLQVLLDDWKSKYDFVGSYYINIGNNPAQGETTNWAVSGPYYKNLMAKGNEIGNHSYTHPDDTNLLTPAQLEFQFNQARLEIEKQLGISVLGTAVPGNPDRLPTSLAISQYTKYLTGGGTAVGSGYPGAFGFLTAASGVPVLCPNIDPDFTLIEFRKLTAAQAQAIWLQQYDASNRGASQPIVHWPWHDYGATVSAIPSIGYTQQMYTALVSHAFTNGSEFVTGADLLQRLNAMLASSLRVDTGSAVTATVGGSGLGTFSLLVKPPAGTTQPIGSVDNWFAYDAERVFVPDQGGSFKVNFAATPSDVTRITSLPMRARLLSLSGNGTNLKFSFFGSGKVKLIVKSGSTNYQFLGADGVSRSGNEVTLTFNTIKQNNVDITGSSCGDGAVASAEACDDGNLAGNDGCSSTCTVEAGFTCAGSPSICSNACGDGLLNSGEQCDDKNKLSGDGCNAACKFEAGYSCSGIPSVCLPTCGDGLLTGGEVCDDANVSNNDGCSASCNVEIGYGCSGIPSVCQKVCGNGLLDAGEQCDDKNLLPGDGCNVECKAETGFSCTGTPSVCSTTCGNGIVTGTEQCDDGNLNSSDGCSGSCMVDIGYACSGNPSVCVRTCGDGVVNPGEQCDDKNFTNGDGCSAQCGIESGFTCAGQPSICAPKCGDGIVSGGEVCDDRNLASGDGCSNVCLIETGFSCSGVPSTCVRRTGQVVLYSNPLEDGWLRTDSGGATTVNGLTLGSSGLRIGDDKRRRTFRSVLSFDLNGVPVTATITSAVLELRRGATAGPNPFTLGPAIVALKGGFFGGTSLLENGDYSAPADVATAATFGNLGGANAIYSIPLNSGALTLMKGKARVQARLSFASLGNSDNTADYAGFYPGDALLQSNRPRLIVTYALP